MTGTTKHIPVAFRKPQRVGDHRTRIRSVRANTPLRCVNRAIRQAGVPDHEQCVLQRVDGLEPLNLPELARFPNHLPE